MGSPVLVSGILTFFLENGFIVPFEILIFLFNSKENIFYLILKFLNPVFNREQIFLSSLLVYILAYLIAE